LKHYGDDHDRIEYQQKEEKKKNRLLELHA